MPTDIASAGTSRQPLASVKPDDAVARSRAISNLIANQAHSGSGEVLTSHVPESLVYPDLSGNAVAGVRSLQLLRPLSQPLPHAELFSASENPAGLMKPRREVPAARRAQSALPQMQAQQWQPQQQMQQPQWQPPPQQQMRQPQQQQMQQPQWQQQQQQARNEQAQKEQRLRAELEQLRQKLAKAELSSAAREKELRHELEAVKQQRDQALADSPNPDPNPDPDPSPSPSPSPDPDPDLTLTRRLPMRMR